MQHCGQRGYNAWTNNLFAINSGQFKTFIITYHFQIAPIVQTMLHCSLYKSLFSPGGTRQRCFIRAYWGITRSLHLWSCHDVIMNTEHWAVMPFLCLPRQPTRGKYILMSLNKILWQCSEKLYCALQCQVTKLNRMSPCFSGCSEIVSLKQELCSVMKRFSLYIQYTQWNGFLN